MAKKQEKELTFENFIRFPDGHIENWNDIDAERQKEITRALNIQAMRAIGYELVEEKLENA